MVAIYNRICVDEGYLVNRKHKAHSRVTVSVISNWVMPELPWTSRCEHDSQLHLAGIVFDATRVSFEPKRSLSLS
jgi:hypothetical protein